MSNKALALASASGFLFLSSIASAAPVQYSYSGTDGSYSFIDSDTPLATEISDGGQFTLFEDGLDNGVFTQQFPVTFYSSSEDGGTSAPFSISATGPQLYSQSESDPLFSTQTTALTDSNGASGTFSVTSVAAAPEPGAWALMILGIGMIGGMLGYRKRAFVDHKPKLAVVG